MQPIEYVVRQDAPGKYFRCPSYGTMSVSACARNFEEAPNLLREGRLQRCVGCAIGCSHAGNSAAAEPIAAASMVYRVACVRCRRDGRTEGTRLIGRLRLVRQRTICVSCYNREREVLVGANAKGAIPRKWRGLFNTRCAFVRDRRAIVIDHPDPVIDRIELALTMFRRGHQRGVAWARPSVQRIAGG